MYCSNKHDRPIYKLTYKEDEVAEEEKILDAFHAGGNHLCICSLVAREFLTEFVNGLSHIY